MGLAEVKSFERGATGAEVVVDKGGGDIVRADHIEPAGDDSQPLPGDQAVLVTSAESGGEIAVAYLDPKNDGKAGPGEKRVVGRDSSGKPIVWFWAKSDGTGVLENEQGVFELAPDGNVRASKDLKVDGNLEVGGELKVDGEITWNAGTVPTKASTHTHPTAMGPSGPATPGT